MCVCVCRTCAVGLVCVCVCVEPVQLDWFITVGLAHMKLWQSHMLLWVLSGRSRKRGGRSILMAMPKIIEQEELNRKREQLMYAALRLIRAMPPEKITAFVLSLIHI